MRPGLDEIPGGVIVLRGDLRIAFANQAAGALMGLAAEELIGKSFDVMLSAPSRILFQTHVYPALKADGRVEEVFLTLASTGGDPIPVLLNATRSGRAEAYVCLIVRMLARARWESELLSATRAIAEEQAATKQVSEELAATARDLADRYAAEQRARALREAVVGVVSHELRTPITTIYGMSQVLRQSHDSLDPKVVHERLVDIESESDRLRRLTDDLLVLGRTEGAGLQVARDPVVMGHLVRATIKRERVHAKGHRVIVDVKPGLPLIVAEDLYVEQVLGNLLRNAWKYSPAGTDVRVIVTSEDGGVATRVVDSGPGLGDQAPEQLFELFYRSETAKRHTSGAGIGLFVCRELIAAMGGRIWATSRPPEFGTGAEFGFWLPAVAGEDF